MIERFAPEYRPHMRIELRSILVIVGVMSALSACGAATPGGATSTTTTAGSTTSRCSSATGTARPSSSVCANSGAGGTSAPATAGPSSFTMNGTYHSVSLLGHVVDLNIECTPITTGTSSGVQVIWGGILQLQATGKSESVSGDISIPQFGSFTLPGTDPKSPTASIVVANDYANRYALSAPSTGSGTVSATLNYGAIDATFEENGTGPEVAALKGSWNC